MTILYSSLQLGLLYGIMVLGIYISFRILDIPDLTTEGSFAFGVAVSAVMAKAGHPYLGLLLSIVAGIAAGCFTGLLQTKLKIHPILAGIITMSGLYSINLGVMHNSPNLTLLNTRTIFTDFRNLMPGVDKGNSQNNNHSSYCNCGCRAFVIVFQIAFRPLHKGNRR